MTQNVITAEFRTTKEAEEAYQRIQMNASSNGYEIYQGALVESQDDSPKILNRFTTGSLTRSHLISDWAIGAFLGILFGVNGFLIGGLIGLIAGAIYDTNQMSRDRKLINEAGRTAESDIPTLVLLANEKYEDALDRYIYSHHGMVHRAYTGDLKEQMHSRHLTGISMNL